MSESISVPTGTVYTLRGPMLVTQPIRHRLRADDEIHILTPGPSGVPLVWLTRRAGPFPLPIDGHAYHRRTRNRRKRR